MPATKFIQPANSAFIALRRDWPTRPISLPVRDSSVATNDWRDLYKSPGSAREYRRDIIGGGRVFGRIRVFSWTGKWVLGRPRRRYGISRRRSRSEGFIGERLAERRAAFVWRGEDGGDEGRGRGGRSVGRSEGTEWRPM